MAKIQCLNIDGKCQVEKGTGTWRMVWPLQRDKAGGKRATVEEGYEMLKLIFSSPEPYH